LSRALVIFSGGQDSTTCLAWAKNRFEQVEAITFFYGQTHEIEIQQAKKIALTLGVPHHLMDISFYKSMVHSVLTGDAGNINDQHPDNPDLPASFVPNRNALFILLAHSFAQTIKASTLIAGLCQTDYSGYPDCRENFAKAMMQALNLGADTQVELKTPLMFLTKAETFALAAAEGVLELVVKESHTCYQGSAQMHPWGRGCDACPACGLRKKGYHEFMHMKEQHG